MKLVPSGSRGADRALDGWHDDHGAWPIGSQELFAAGGRVSGVVLLDTSTGKLAEITFGLPAVFARGGAVLPVVMKGMQRRKTIVEKGRSQAGDVLWVFIKRIAFGGPVDPGLAEFVDTQMIAATPVDVIADFYPALMSHDKLSALDALRGTATWRSSVATRIW